MTDKQKKHAAAQLERYRDFLREGCTTSGQFYVQTRNEKSTRLPELLVGISGSIISVMVLSFLLVDKLFIPTLILLVPAIMFCFFIIIDAIDVRNKMLNVNSDYYRDSLVFCDNLVRELLKRQENELLDLEDYQEFLRKMNEIKEREIDKMNTIVTKRDEEMKPLEIRIKSLFKLNNQIIILLMAAIGIQISLRIINPNEVFIFFRFLWIPAYSN